MKGDDVARKEATGDRAKAGGDIVAGVVVALRLARIVKCGRATGEGDDDGALTVVWRSKRVPALRLGGTAVGNRERDCASTKTQRG